jgi:hypothetical protein
VQVWLGCAHSSCGREGAVDIEEADRVLDRALGERRDDAGGGSGGGHCGGILFLFVRVCVVVCVYCTVTSSRVSESCVASGSRCEFFSPVFNKYEKKQEGPVGSECLFMYVIEKVCMVSQITHLLLLLLLDLSMFPGSGSAAPHILVF